MAQTTSIHQHTAAAQSWSRLRQRLRRLLRPRRKLSFTRLGRWYCGLTLGIGVAAINTGNNLLFLVLALLLSGILVSGVLSELALRGVTISRRLPSFASAGAEALVGLAVENAKRRAPSFSLELREKGSEVSGRAYLLALPPGGSAELAYHFVPARRGVHRFSSLVIATRSPFGLFEKSREVELRQELVVFPRRVPAPSWLADSEGRLGDRPALQAGHGIEVHALREHRPGEDVRTVHWRTSARAGKLIALEREQERRRLVCVVLDHRKLAGSSLERAVELAAALVERELSVGADVALALCGRTFPCGRGPAHLHALLTALALVEEARGAAAPRPPANAAILRVPPAAAA